MAKAELTIGDKWLLIGNLMTVLGGGMIGIGTILKLSAGTGLPSGRPVFNSGGATIDQVHAQGHGRDARDYFSI